MDEIVPLLIGIFISLLLIFFLHVRSTLVHRDSSPKIRERLRRSLIASFAAAFTCFCYFSWEDRNVSVYKFSTEIGLLPGHFVLPFMYSATALIALFLGNFLICLDEHQMSLMKLCHRFREEYFTDENGKLRFCRNYLVAPLVEEFIYRCCILPILLPSLGWSSVIIAPLLFGFAHLHHAYELYHFGHQVKSIAFKTLFQTAYTTLFGCYVAYLFVVTRNLWLIWFVHAFCNWAGLPDFEALLYFSNTKRLTYSLVYVTGLISFVYINVNFIHESLGKI